MTKNNYRNDLDLLKGIAILAVVLYHMKFAFGGYLGVDVFFVINGFLIVPKVMSEIIEGQFRYFSFLGKRIWRLLPLLLLVTILALLVGYWGMLPDDYENLAESVVATNFFSNNLLALISITNYWDVFNDYKPLMHTWYIGILFEFYLIFPLILMLVKWLSGKLHFNSSKYSVAVMIFLSIVSVLLYLNPFVSSIDRFYLLQYRFFELAFGGLMGLWIANKRKGHLYSNGILSGICFAVLLIILYGGIFSVMEHRTDFYILQNALLLLTVILTTFFVAFDNMKSHFISLLVGATAFCKIGMMSYSIFIWHQPVLAFHRYFFTSNFTHGFVVFFFVVLLVCSYVTYRFVEQKVKAGMRTRIVMFIAFAFINVTAFLLYLHAGVVRDVPELGIQMNNVHRNMHAEYVDRIYSYDKEFPMLKNGRMNVLVIGNSFARDWSNVLLESEIADKINLSYIYQIGEQYIGRIKQADCIFVYSRKQSVPYYVWENLKPGTEVWGIGTKSFGENNGAVYKNRHRSYYFQQTVKIDPKVVALNEQMKREWKDKYIDLLGIVAVKGDEVVVFTDEHKFISQDTRHLTKWGADFYAKQIDLVRFLK